jgi:hypothetical protein
MKKKFPLNHVIKYDTKEIWMECNSSITAMGVSSLVDKYYPGYSAKIGTKNYLDTLKNQFSN